MLILVTLCLLGSLGCLFTAYFTEPGLLPTVDEEIETSADGKPSRPKKYVVLPGDEKRSDLLDFRAKYCRNTSNTVEKFDHFCPWTGNAVGVRNYRYYFCFLVFTNVLATVVLLTSCIAAVSLGSGGSSNSKQNLTLLWLLVVFCAIILMLVGSLLLYHVPLVSRNMTTNEDIKCVYSGANGRNPYDRGCMVNWCNFLKTTMQLPRCSYVSSNNSQIDFYDDGEHNSLLA
jgi:hypothetical protein